LLRIDTSRFSATVRGSCRARRANPRSRADERARAECATARGAEITCPLARAAHAARDYESTDDDEVLSCASLATDFRDDDDARQLFESHVNRGCRSTGRVIELQKFGVAREKCIPFERDAQATMTMWCKCCSRGFEKQLDFTK
jgi:hypothetical protein